MPVKYVQLSRCPAVCALFWGGDGFFHFTHRASYKYFPWGLIFYYLAILATRRNPGNQERVAGGGQSRRRRAEPREELRLN